MAPLPPTRIISKPGIKRDGTQFEGDFYVDGQWVRWQRGLPRKMGGYRQISTDINGPVREVSVDNQNGETIIHTFWSGGIDRIAIDNLTGVTTGVINRSPVGFVANAANDWTTATMFNGASSLSVVLAHVAPNMQQIDNEAGGLLYFGDSASIGAFTQITDANITGANALSGGIVVLNPYLVVFGQDGTVAWCVPNNPTDFTGAGSGRARVTDQKIVAGLVLRGGPGSSPSGLLWSLNALIRMYFTGGSTVFAFDTISDGISIMSPNAVCEFEGIYYWVGIDKFYMFNGVVREMPNPMNMNWFFDNLNYSQRMKVFAFAVPRWGEIWFCYPRGNATECTHAVIFNARETAGAGAPVWYDTKLPDDFRSAAATPRVFPYPLMCGSPAVVGGKHRLFQHEIGVDAVGGVPAISSAIESFFETGEISTVGGTVGQPQNKYLSVDFIEPDFVQSGDMTIQIKGRANARAADVVGSAISFPATATAINGSDQLVPAKESRRLLRFKFASNTIGGDYQMGYVIAHINLEDGTMIGGPNT